MIPIVLADDDLVVIDKPAGLALIGDSLAVKAGVALVAKLAGSDQLYPVIPLEQHVSGLTVLARSAPITQALGQNLMKHPPRMEYTAVVQGQFKPAGGKRSGRDSAAAAVGMPKVIRRRRQLSLVSFEHPSMRTAEIRAGVQNRGQLVLGDMLLAKAKHKANSRRPRGRLFLHRAKLSFRHPTGGKMVSVSVPPPRVFDAALTAADLLDDTLEVALMARLPGLADESSDTLRLFNGLSDGIAGLVAERFGPVVTLQTHQGKYEDLPDRLQRVAKWYRRWLRVAAVYHKRFLKDASRAVEQAGGDELLPMLGPAQEEEIVVQEGGLAFAVRPGDGLNVGLFLDQRGNRRRVREQAAGRWVLNTFAYTCSFSVAAAVGGAAGTVSVDQSKLALDWGRHNFELNGIELGNHLFFRREVFDYLKQAQRQDRRFGLIILDPPSFARSKRPQRVFSLVQDLRGLIVAALAVLEPQGLMLININHRSSSLTWLKDEVAAAAGQDNRRFHFTATPPLPLDFAGDRHYAKSLWVRFD